MQNVLDLRHAGPDCKRPTKNGHSLENWEINVERFWHVGTYCDKNPKLIFVDSFGFILDKMETISLIKNYFSDFGSLSP